MAYPLPTRKTMRISSTPGSSSGFTIIELMAVLLLMGTLLALGGPALWNVLATYKMRSSAQQLEILGRQARFESIKLGQPVTVIVDTNRNMFYAYSGTLTGMPPYSLPHGAGDLPPLQRVAVWQVPRGVLVDLTPLKTPCSAAICDVFSFTSDGQGTGGDVLLKGKDPNLTTYTLSVSKPTGKITIK
jgi:prepilin-type N-terminal cleavage/methylation domain-containing protein